jgi:hypothetical protein
MWKEAVVKCLKVISPHFLEEIEEKNENLPPGWPTFQAEYKVEILTAIPRHSVTGECHKNGLCMQSSRQLDG